MYRDSNAIIHVVCISYMAVETLNKRARALLQTVGFAAEQLYSILLVSEAIVCEGQHK